MILLFAKDLQGRRLDLFFCLDHLPASVITALRAGLMRRFRLQTLRAYPRSDRLQKVMRASLAASRLGVSPFRIRHDLLFLHLGNPRWAWIKPAVKRSMIYSSFYEIPTGLIIGRTCSLSCRDKPHHSDRPRIYSTALCIPLDKRTSSA